MEPSSTLPTATREAASRRSGFGRDACLAGFLVGGAFGLVQAWTFLAAKDSVLPASLVPIVAVGIVAAHAALGSALLFLAAPILRPLVPGGSRKEGDLPLLCAIAGGATAGLERAAHLLAEGKHGSLALALDGIVLASAVALLVGFAASRLARHPPRGPFLGRILPFAVASGVFLLGARGLLTQAGGGAPSAGRVLALVAVAALLGSLARTLARPFFREPSTGLARRAGRILAAVIAASALPAGAVALLGSRGEPEEALRARPPSRDLPNVLLLTVDTLRADAVGFAREPLARTPNLEALAARGTVFENAYAASAWTLPALASLFTSRFPSECGTGRTGEESGPILAEFWRKGRLEASLPTLATALDVLGYETAGIVTNVWLGRRFGFDRGFDRYRDTTRGEPLRALRPLRLYRIARRFFPGLDADGTLAERTTALALEELEALGEGPFFLWVHYIDPHLPYAAPGASARTADALDAYRGGRFVPEEVRPRVLASYLAEVAYVDREIGRLLRALEDRGLRDRTLVLFTSDHGEEFWEHGGFEHGHTFHAEVTRVPLVVVRPGGEGAGSRIARLVSHLDLFPTVLDLLGSPFPPEARGRSLFAPEGDPRPLFAESLLYGSERRWARTDRRLLALDPRSGEIERIDLEADPGERTLAPPGDPGSASVEEELRAWSAAMLEEAREWIRRSQPGVGDPLGEDWLQQVGYIRK
jgi:hypothetical protein